ncbi:MAG: helix-hairpin-helix domain-containing protein [Pseudomonadota bacterium]|nr:helix-hairpin-helix domain-containing protein [Pseudomonadota bacterium]
MAFSSQEKAALLAVKGVGPTVIKRFEEIGIHSFAELTQYSVDDIAQMVASMLRTSCWKNSPQAKMAISAAIERAKLTL